MSKLSALKDLRYALPAQLERMQAQQGMQLFHDDGVLLTYGRAFIRARLPLPLGQPSSPLGVWPWVETSLGQAAQLLALRAGARRALRGSGILANELEAFPGSIGAKVSFSCRTGREWPMISACADERIARAGQGLTGEALEHELLRLYRLLFGGPEHLARSSSELRAKAQALFEAAAGGHVFARPLEPPPFLAGLEPPQLLVRPPLDTGGEARLATIGMAEAAAYPGIELCTAVRDNHQAFEDCFSAFAFWNRLGGQQLCAGAPVLELAGGIEGAPQMAGWLIMEQYETSEGPLCPVSPPGYPRFLAALPMHRDELFYAGHYSGQALLERAQAAALDLADLERPSALA